MIYFLEYNDWNNLKLFVCEITNLNFFDNLNSNNLSIRRSRLTSWSELSLEISKSEDIFEQESNDLLIDIADLKITKEFEKSIPQKPSGKIIFYSSTRDSLTAEEKKLLKKNKIIYEKLTKTDYQTLNEIARTYIQRNKLEIDDKTKEIISKNSATISELLDNLDYIDLLENKEKGLNELFVEPPLPVFMLPFRPDRAKEDAKKWKNKINEEEIQLGLSLIFGKLEKSGNSKAKKMMGLLIKTDKTMKTRGGISPSLWWKLFLWRCQQEV